MAARNTTDSKRIVFHSPSKESEAYFSQANRSGTNVSSQNLQPSTLSSAQAPPPPTMIRSADLTTPRTEVVTPARRIVVIRNTKNPQMSQAPVDLGVLGRSNSSEIPPVISDGHKSVYLIRRPIPPPEPSKAVESSQPVQEPSSTTTLEHMRIPTSPKEIVTSLDPPRPTSPPNSPPIRPKSSKRPASPTHPETSQRYAPYLRRSRSKLRTPSPVHPNSRRQSSSPNRTRSRHLKRHSPSPPPPKQEESKNTHRKRSFFSYFSRKNTNESVNSLSPVIVKNEQQTTTKSVQQKKSAKPVVLVNPNEQSIAIIENSYLKGESLRPVIKRPKSFKKTRFQDEFNNKSTENLVKTSRWQTCLGCLARHMCLIIIICFFLVLIGLAGVGVSTYFLVTSSSNNLVPTIVGIAVGGVLAIAALCFLYILLGCIGIHEGYFTYNDNDEHVGGRAFALIPPSHSNAHLYIPRDYMTMTENNHPPPMIQKPSTPASKVLHRQLSLMGPVSTIPYNQQQTTHRTNTSINGFENKSNKNHITIEMPERLLTGRELSPRSRERSLTNVVKNIGHIVEDTKKRYNGDTLHKVIVKVDKENTQTA